MKYLSHQSILEILKDLLLDEDHLVSDKFINSVCLHTDHCSENCLFIAYVGAKADGHSYIKLALENGASLALISKREYHIPDKTILVKDVELALWEIARFVRDNIINDRRIIALTGSVGKTSLKEFIAHFWSVYRNKANFNNHWGLPMTIVNTLREEELPQDLLFEVGMNHSGEIRKLTSLLRPNVSIIIKIDYAHIGNFPAKNIEESLLQVCYAKSEIMENLVGEKIAILPKHDRFYPKLKKIALQHNCSIYNFNYSIDPEADIEVLEYSQDQVVVRVQEQGIYKIPHMVFGQHQQALVALAYGIGKILRLPPKNDTKVIESLEGRGKIHIIGKKMLVNDSYNSSINAMKLGINSFMEMDFPGPAIIVLGSMFEFGDYDVDLHKGLLDYVLSLPPKKEICLYLIGASFINVAKNVDAKIKIASFVNVASLLKQENLFPEECGIYLKGSHKNQLWLILEHLKSRIIL